MYNNMYKVLVPLIIYAINYKKDNYLNLSLLQIPSFSFSAICLVLCNHIL